MSVVRHLESVATTPELRAAYNAVQPKVSAFYSSLPLNEGLWKAIKRYAATDEAEIARRARCAFSNQDHRFVQAARRGPRSGGQGAAEGDRRRADRGHHEVLGKRSGFHQRLGAGAHRRSAAPGLPPAAVAAARASAESKGKEGWRFTLQAPSYIAVMTYLDDARSASRSGAPTTRGRSRRRTTIAPLIAKILELRKEKAKLLGFRDFADLVLDDRMAHTGERAQNFLDDLREKTEPRFREENQELEAFAGQKLEPWDIGYWAEKQRAALVRFRRRSAAAVLSAGARGRRDVRDLRPHARHSRGARRTACRCGIRRCDATRFTMRRAAQHLGSFYADWYPRENKRGGAWMDSLITGNPVHKARPHLGLDLRQSDAAGGRQARAADASRSRNDLPRVRPPAASSAEPRGGAQSGGHQRRRGISSSCLRRSWRTGAGSASRWICSRGIGKPASAIPEDLFQKMKRAKTFRAANSADAAAGLRLRGSGAASRMGRQGTTSVAYARRMLQPFAATPLPDDYAMIAGFTHLFASPVGYGAGYYSYKWAEVLDADAFTRFRKEGVFKRRQAAIIAKRFWRAATAKIPRCCTARSWDAIRTRMRCWCEQA